MTDHHLSTILRDALTEEPPVSVTSADAMRTGRRQDRHRRALTGSVCALAIVGAAAIVPSIVGGAPEETRSAATYLGPSDPDPVEVMKNETAAALAPYVSDLGQPKVGAFSVDGPVDPDDPTLQILNFVYRPTGGETVQLDVRVMGFAPSNADMFGFSDVPPVRSARAGGQLHGGVPRRRHPGLDRLETWSVQADEPVLIPVKDALKNPGDVLWHRSVSVSTPGGVAVGVSEMVARTTRTTPSGRCRWRCSATSSSTSS